MSLRTGEVQTVIEPALYGVVSKEAFVVPAHIVDKETDGPTNIGYQRALATYQIILERVGLWNVENSFPNLNGFVGINGCKSLLGVLEGYHVFFVGGNRGRNRISGAELLLDRYMGLLRQDLYSIAFPSTNTEVIDGEIYPILPHERTIALKMADDNRENIEVLRTSEDPIARMVYQIESSLRNYQTSHMFLCDKSRDTRGNIKEVKDNIVSYYGSWQSNGNSTSPRYFKPLKLTVISQRYHDHGSRLTDLIERFFGKDTRFDASFQAVEDITRRLEGYDLSYDYAEEEVRGKLRDREIQHEIQVDTPEYVAYDPAHPGDYVPLQRAVSTKEVKEAELIAKVLDFDRKISRVSERVGFRFRAFSEVLYSMAAVKRFISRSLGSN
ncbi:MAG: hypothetical protein ACP5N7_05570 [Candidatus Pacearchaeota archaeon]